MRSIRLCSCTKHCKSALLASAVEPLTQPNPTHPSSNHGLLENMIRGVVINPKENLGPKRAQSLAHTWMSSNNREHGTSQVFHEFSGIPSITAFLGSSWTLSAEHREPGAPPEYPLHQRRGTSIFCKNEEFPLLYQRKRVCWQNFQAKKINDSSKLVFCTVPVNTRSCCWNREGVCVWSTKRNASIRHIPQS